MQLVLASASPARLMLLRQAGIEPIVHPTDVDEELRIAAHEAEHGPLTPAEYVLLGTKREQVRMAGNAVTPPAARDLVGAVAASLN